MDIFQDLNQKQIEAVKNVDGPVLVIAGAGSGKTKTLTHRIAYLIREMKVDPRNILAVTFTNKAAGEMKDRVAKLLNGGIENSQFPIPAIGTFHSICVRILRREAKNIGLPQNFLIYDADDQSSIIKESLKELNAPLEQFKPSSILAAISSAKNKLESPEEFLEKADGYFQSVAAKCYAIYQNKLKKTAALDFDDLIMAVVSNFKKDAQFLKKYQQIFKFILVDEYQDTNRAQYQFARLLAENHKNICAVGDDWQSIYKWRGADIANILEFEKDYPEAKIILLEQNYRSRQNILDVSYAVISKNINRKEKKLWSAKEKGSPIVIARTQTEKEEGYFIVKKIRELVNDAEIENFQPLQYKDFAVLYRTNAQSRALEEAFVNSGIPYKIIGGLKFYSRKEIKDILAYLRVVQNPLDKAGISRIINIPPRGIGKATLDKIIRKIDSTESLDGDFINDLIIEKIAGSKQSAIDSFFKLISICKEKSKEFPLVKLMDFLLAASGYGEYVKTMDNADERLENIRELFSAAKKFDSAPPEEALNLFLEEAALVADTDDIESESNVVNLMTIHASKGLEFNTVFITGMEEGIFPHSRSANGNLEELEEERRLCYVGMTRAKERLFLTYAQLRNIYGSAILSRPSRFLRDIPEKLVEFDEFGEFGEKIIIADI